MKNLKTSIGNMKLRTPIGLAAGFDKNLSKEPRDYYREGLSWVEYGSITLHPRESNPEPNFFPYIRSQAIINNCGMGNEGIHYVYSQKDWLATGGKTCGISIGLVGDSYNFPYDIIACMNKTHRMFGFYTINLSCPNVGNFNNIYNNHLLMDIVMKVLWNKQKEKHNYNVFLKISPDIDEYQIKNIAEICLSFPVDGIIATNTTKIDKPIERVKSGEIFFGKSARLLAEMNNKTKGRGGLSGKPLFDKSTRVLASLYKHTQGKVPLIGVGGVMDADSAMAKIQAGASALQVYTGYHYGGSEFINNVNSGLLQLLNESKFDSIAQAVGTNHESYL